VSQEKAAALARQCDFCAPSVAEVEPQLTVMPGHHVEMALSDVVELTPVADLAVVVINEPEPTLEIAVTPFEEDAESAPANVEPVELVIVEIEPEPDEPLVPDEVIVEAVIDLLAEEIEEELVQQEEAVAPEPARDRRQRQTGLARRQPAAARRQPRRAPAPAPAPAASTPVRTRRAPVRRAASTRVAATSGQRYEVHYQVDRVIRATSIQDALRQVAAMGVTEVLGITRED
jgi:hypothetical protein